eukprot:TRINITY_DN13820_c0_g3_i2.p1 TRINITY_DN13820_c0_g3~~TRINITY_DN13820_c0_g3_i2.p1  ORF type:complete len:344 (+),score=41.52 TRINITY_DN13820_c0_g3_i2:72-1034(+)
MSVEVTTSSPFPVLKAYGRLDRLQQLQETPLTLKDNFTINFEHNQKQQETNSKYLKQLKTTELGSILLNADEIPSTQDFVCDNHQVLPSGVVVVADVQTKGRGRGGNVWRSPEGCMMFTLLTRLKIDGRWLPHVQYAVCMAVLDAVESLTQINIGLKVKWPNDIYLEDQKVAGVLSQSFYQGGEFCLVIGVGINLENKEPTICLNDVIETKFQSPKLTREVFLAEIMNSLEHLLGIIQFEGFKPLQDKYLEQWMHQGQKLLLEQQDSDNKDTQIPVTIVGLAENGFLLAIDKISGEQVELHPNGNTLDMMKGLILRKQQS